MLFEPIRNCATTSKGGVVQVIPDQISAAILLAAVSSRSKGDSDIALLIGFRIDAVKKLEEATVERHCRSVDLRRCRGTLPRMREVRVDVLDWHVLPPSICQNYMTRLAGTD